MIAKLDDYPGVIEAYSSPLKVVVNPSITYFIPEFPEDEQEEK